MFWVSWPVVLIDLKYWYDCDFNKFSDEICGTIYHIVQIYNQWFVVFWRQSAEISCEKNIKDVFLYQCCLHWPVTHSGNASFKQFPEPQGSSASGRNGLVRAALGVTGNFQNVSKWDVRRLTSVTSTSAKWLTAPNWRKLQSSLKDSSYIMSNFFCGCLLTLVVMIFCLRKW